jgi:hypothetical protein
VLWASLPLPISDEFPVFLLAGVIPFVPRDTVRVPHLGVAAEAFLPDAERGEGQRLLLEQQRSRIGEQPPVEGVAPTPRERTLLSICHRIIRLNLRDFAESLPKCADRARNFLLTHSPPPGFDVPGDRRAKKNIDF